VAGCHAVFGPKTVKVTEERWTFGDTQAKKLVTDHFDIHSTIADQEFERALPAFLEAAHQQYADLLPAPPNSTERLRTYVFNSREQWERFTKERFPRRFDLYRRIGTGGFAEGNLCVVYHTHRTYTLSVLAHEGMHQYFANHFNTPLPAWTNEGLACYCESFELSGGRPVFTPRRNTFRMNSLREALATGSILPLREMLSTDAGQVILQGQSRLTQTYYAQVWALVVFMRHCGHRPYATGFERMLADIAGGELPRVAQAAKIRSPSPGRTSFGEAVFRAYFTEDLDRFEREFKLFMHDLAGFKRPAEK
jgi:hypothetical protein